MTYAVSIFFVLIFSACTHTAPTVSAPAEKPRAVSTDERVDKTNMELEYKDLSAVMNVVMLTVDGDQYGCAIAPDKLPQLSQLLRMSLDERFAADKDTHLRGNAKERAVFFPKNCAAECSCAAYSAFMDYLRQQDVKFTAKEKKLSEKISGLAEKESQNLQACVETQKWVCESKIFKSLLVE